MPAPTDTVTEEEYLVREPEAEYKSEYRDGRVVAMSGASPAHSKITINLVREISNQLMNGRCAAFSSDTRIKVAAAHFYTYPDLSVACEEPQFDPRDACALLNPTQIVEVLSPGAEAYDRGQKFEYYKKLASLREYILVAQDRIHVERFSRLPNEVWSVVQYTSYEDWVLLPAIDCSVSVEGIYHKVKIPH
jgi:Uma2 family endonuclease